MTHEITYAIGDVHGEAARLGQLHASIFERHALLYPGAPLCLVHMGDYIDRGPDSAGVIEDLYQLSINDEINTIMLAGNHEAMMIEALRDPVSSDYQHWLQNGGDATLKSYRARGYDGVPEAHIDWLCKLPTIHVDENSHRIFVHAGLRPKTFPNESAEVHLWTRARDFFDTGHWEGTELEGWTVVHGHTPTEDGWPDIQGEKSRRINIDTGAVFGGRLTCAVFAPGENVRFIYA